MKINKVQIAKFILFTFLPLVLVAMAMANDKVGG